MTPRGRSNKHSTPTRTSIIIREDLDYRERSMLAERFLFCRFTAPVPTRTVQYMYPRDRSFFKFIVNAGSVHEGGAEQPGAGLVNLAVRDIEPTGDASRPGVSHHNFMTHACNTM